MKKLVLLLQKSETEFHLGSILALLILVIFVFFNLTLYASFAYILIMPLYSYSSGFVYIKNGNRSILRHTVFIFLLLSSFSFVIKSFLDLNLLYYFGKINVTEQEVRGLKSEVSRKILFLLLSVLITWITLITILRRQGIKSAVNQLKNEFEKTPQT